MSFILLGIAGHARAAADAIGQDPSGAPENRLRDYPKYRIVAAPAPRPGLPGPLDADEPAKVADSIAKPRLEHAVVTIATTLPAAALRKIALQSAWYN